MTEREKLTKLEFLERCGTLLGSAHHGVPFPYTRRTRWNNRAPGPGRYPGRGVIRIFSERAILVLLRAPVHVSATFASYDDALDYLNGLVG